MTTNNAEHQTVPQPTTAGDTDSWTSWVATNEAARKALGRAHDLLSMMSAFRYEGLSTQAGGSLGFALWELDDGGAQPASLSVELSSVSELLEHDRARGTSARDNLLEVVQCLLVLVAHAPDLPETLRHQRALSYVEQAAAVDDIALELDDSSERSD
jgi:hypothetical protein